MALKIGKLSLEQIIAGINALSEEDKAKVSEMFNGEVENDAPVEEVEKTDAVEEPTEESVEEVENATNEEVETPTEEPQEEVTEEVTEETDAPVEEPERAEEVVDAVDDVAEDNKDAIIQTLTDRVTALENGLKELDELKALMQEYTSKQAEQFGYKGSLLGAKKDVKDMSVEELKSRQMKGI